MAMQYPFIKSEWQIKILNVGTSLVTPLLRDEKKPTIQDGVDNILEPFSDLKDIFNKPCPRLIL